MGYNVIKIICESEKYFNKKVTPEQLLENEQIKIKLNRIYYLAFNYTYSVTLRELPGEISKLTELEILALDQSITTPNFVQLEKLIKLKELTWRPAQNNLELLQHLTQLRKLDLNYAQMTNITPLSHLTELKELNLHGCKNLEDFSVLQHLTKLDILDLSYTKITNLSVLQYLTQLQKLNLHGTKMTRISPLRYLTKLKDLNLEYCKEIEDTYILQYLTKLQKLNLEDLTIPDISTGEYLHELTLTFFQWGDTGRELREKEKKEQIIREIGRIDLKFLEFLTHLKWLNLRGTKILHRNIDSLKKLKKLKYVSFEFAKLQIESEKFLRKFHNKRPDLELIY